MSQRFSLDSADLQKWAKNLVIFSAPSLIIFLSAVSNGVPVHTAVLALYGALINAIIDLLRKFSADNQQMG